MATMIERKAESERKEIAKLEKRLEREEAKLAKATAKAEKMDALERKDIWDEPNPENPGWRKPEHIPYVSAFMDYIGARYDVEDTKRRLENAKKRLAALMPKVEEQEESNKETERIESIESGCVKWATLTKEELEKRRAEYEKWLAEFKAECKRDGVTIEEACGAFVIGLTKSGKQFVLYINTGRTVRSWHCYTLRIDGKTLFTSGEFETAYRVIKR